MMSTTTAAPPTTTSSTPAEGWRFALPGRSTGPLGHPVVVVRLIEQLTGLGVKLPAELVRFRETFEALDALRQPDAEPVVGLRADADQVAAMVMAAAQRRAVLAEVGSVVDQVHRELLADGASWFQANCDSVLDQLRPGFDKAAAAVRAAVKAGVGSTTGRLGDLPDNAIALWRNAFGSGAATDVLNRIASARYALSESCWIAPMETGVSNRGDFSVAFNAHAGWWDRIGRSWETVTNPQLLSIGDTLALRWERRPSVYADRKAEDWDRKRLADTDRTAARQPAPADLDVADVAGRV